MIEFIRASEESDWHTLLLLRKVTEKTQAASGLYTPEQLADGRLELARHYTRGMMWLARTNRETVGAVGLGGPDMRMWDDNPDHPQALYLYKVMAVPGKNIGSRLVEFAEFQARMKGLSLLRLDCLRDNPKLHEFWKSQGFEHLGDVPVLGYTAGALFEKKISI
jgi:GNAT superfamily N-acetyltransferase